MDPKINLKTILENHAKWLRGESGGMRANLEGANLDGAYLVGSNLERAYLMGANLMGSNLRGSNLRGANLEGANLRGSYLERANLEGANLDGAYLRGSYLERANLEGANLDGANLMGANLKNCTGAELALAMASHLPDGTFDGWKKCRNGVIVRLRIPAESRRSHGTERKCRCEYARVIEVYGPDGISKRGLVGISIYDGKTEYRKGKMVRCDKWDNNRWNTCRGGIHFYLTRIEAENHQ